MMKILSKGKYIAISLTGLIVIVLLFKFNTYTQNYFINNNKIQMQIDKIKNAEEELNYKILLSNIYLYSNNDEIDIQTKKLLKAVDDLEKNEYFSKEYPGLYKKLLFYKKLILKKTQKLYEFQTLNSMIKNSTMYLSNLLKDIVAVKHDYLENAINVVLNIYLAKSAQDVDFIKNIDIGFFKNYKTDDYFLQNYNKIFVGHLNVFIRYFPKFRKTLSEITNSSALNVINNIQQGHLQKVNEKIKIIKFVSYVLIAFVLLSGVIIMLLLSKVEKDYIELQKLNESLHKAYITDALTELYNRNKFDEDIKNIDKPKVMLVNIDRFKHFNDYFGVEFGDKILKYVGNKINNIAKKHNISTVYILGTDDFGILAQKEKCKILECAKEIINYFENNEINIDGIVVNISVSIGISDKYPYLENADIALKNTKTTHRENIIYFTPEMDYKNKIAQNIQKTNILYEALKEDRIALYFQPIVDKEGKAIKYEVLSRVIHKDGKVESIFPYLEVAKESRLYQKITLKVLEKSYEFLQKNRVNLSLNLSIEDILDDTIQQTIERLFFNKDIAPYVTFELLESEAIEDYELIEKFVKKVKSQNMQVAIDDFGSGYSNFEHILNLNVDILKIDGSLIKNISTNENAKKVVKTINMFAKECKITTVAEYVSDEEIFNIVKELDIDLFQGFYFSEPKPNIK